MARDDRPRDDEPRDDEPGDHDLPVHDVDGVPRPVFSLITDATFFGETKPHRHDKAQLLYVISGVLTIQAAGGLWTIPPQCALWLPGGTPHAGRVAGHIRIGNLYIDRALASSFDQDCGILFVQPLLRELILRFAAKPERGEEAREARLVAVLMDEVKRAPLEPIRLPMPGDRRLKRLTEAMVENPALRFTIEEWGARVGASTRTLSRLFQRETGMSFVRWRQQLHVGLALQRLAQGDLVTTIAGDLGYESVSAFISMFRRMLGTTPARYFGETASRAEAGGDLGAAEDGGDRKVVPMRRR